MRSDNTSESQRKPGIVQWTSPRLWVVTVAISLNAIILLTYFFPHDPSPGPPKREFSILVTDSQNVPLRGVKVSMNRNKPVVTDTGGTATLALSLNADPIVQLVIAKEGYDTSEGLFVSASETPLHVILSPTSSDELGSSYSQQFVSLPEMSGVGSGFSPWYELSADSPKKGYVIDLDPSKTYYSLSGDRVCNAWSECEWSLHSTQQVAFRFRLQGHSDWPFPGQALSQGFLQVEYKRVEAAH